MKSKPMKISELIAELERRKAKHGDVEVFITWETTIHTFNLREIYASKCLDDGAVALLFDADGNEDKDDYALPDETDREAHVRNYV